MLIVLARYPRSPSFRRVGQLERCIPLPQMLDQGLHQRRIFRHSWVHQQL